MWQRRTINIFESLNFLFGGVMTKSGKKVDAAKKLEDMDLLSRFVVDGSENKIGESIALDGDILIVKSGKTFLGVPLKHVEDIGDALKVKGLVDFDKAVHLGNRWYNKYLKG